MPDFYYICQTLDGHRVQGELTALDKSDLAVQLWKRQLFLVWWCDKLDETRLATKPELGAPPVPISDDTVRKVWEEPKSEKLSEARPIRFEALTFRTGLLLCCLAVSGAWLGYRLTKPQQSPELISQDIVARFKEIRPGMTRAEVERAWSREPVPPLSEVTRYRLPPDIIALIPYDSSGGPLSPTNRVIGHPQLFTDLSKARKAAASKGKP